MKEMGPSALESQEHRDLHDIIDKVRSSGMRCHIDLPKIVVCGDQSSGKSSVLEAISGMTFPTKDSLCTRFATEIILRRTPAPAVSFSIAPAADRPEIEKERLRAFAPTCSLETLDLAQVVDEAGLLMGIGEQKTFSTDVLRVELSGPKQPHLAMVDLPGLFQAGDCEQAADDVDLIRNLVLSYIKPQGAIILAVVSANTAFALQKVTQLAREPDPQGLRTFGIITKPDTLDQGSDSERAFLKLAQNNDADFRLGWHVLRNRDFEARTISLEERNRAEMQFFSQGIWTYMSPLHLGAATLITRLTSVLYDHTLSQLPHVVSDLEEKIEECMIRLKKIGPLRATTHEQHRYLIKASHEFNELMKASADGNYTDPYFGSTEQGNKRRLRAAVQNSLLELDSVMRSEGHARKIVHAGSSPTGPKEVSLEEYFAEVKEILSRNRGRELPGTYNATIIGQLFRDQSQPWKQLLDQRVDLILENACGNVQSVLQYILEESVAEGVFRRILNPSLQDIGQSMRRKVEEIMAPHEAWHPITYNPSLLEIVRKRRLARQEKELKILVINSRDQLGVVSETKILSALLKKAKLDSDRDASADAVDWMEAYYDICLARTVDDFSVLVVESCLIQKLPGLFSPEVVCLLDEDTLRQIVGENETLAAERCRLMEMLHILEAGLGDLRPKIGCQKWMRKAPSAPSRQSTGLIEDNRKCDSARLETTTPSNEERGIPKECPVPEPEDDSALVREQSPVLGDDAALVPGPAPVPVEDEGVSRETPKKIKKKKKKASTLNDPEPA